ncbi:hypothetical protein [Thaumasiovibrio subtropicus]|nr:hypothetical protein [Thaumasiovibrio subtropicus]
MMLQGQRTAKAIALFQDMAEELAGATAGLIHLKGEHISQT